jgi:hypothetical protein
MESAATAEVVANQDATSSRDDVAAVADRGIGLYQTEFSNNRWLLLATAALSRI